MVLFGVFLQLIENKPMFLGSFGFMHYSYFASLGLFTYLYSITLDVPLRIGLRLLNRKFELRADEFAVKQGFGIPFRNALIRSHADSLDNIFKSRFDAILNEDHPDLLTRLKLLSLAIEKQ